MPKPARMPAFTVKGVVGRKGRMKEKGEAGDSRMGQDSPLPSRVLSQNHKGRREKVRKALWAGEAQFSGG